MTAEQFLKSKLSKKDKHVAFTHQEKKTILIWMRQYAKYMILEDMKSRNECSE